MCSENNSPIVKKQAHVAWTISFNADDDKLMMKVNLMIIMKQLVSFQCREDQKHGWDQNVD